MIDTTPKEEQATVSWWRLAFSYQGWRQVIYTFLALPVNILALLMALAGRSSAGFGYQLSVARDLLPWHFPDEQPSSRLRALAYSMITLPLNVAAFAFSAYFSSLLLLSVLYPLRAIARHESLDHILASNYYHAWGGPTFAGAWAVHAVLALAAFLGPIVWVIVLFTWLQARLLQRLHPASL